MQVMGELPSRRAGFDDAELAADLMTASYPAMAQDPVITRLRWENPKRGFAYGRFIAERDGKPVAFLDWVHGPWEQGEDGHCEVSVYLDRAALDRELLLEMFTWIGGLAAAAHSRLLPAYCAENHPHLLHPPPPLDYRPN